MTIALSTTTIAVWRVAADATRDPTDVAPAAVKIASGVRAQISAPYGRERNIGGTQEVVEFSLSCDPTDLTNLDRVQDETTLEWYEVTWARQRTGFGLEHTRAGLKQVTGASAWGAQ